MTNYRQVFKDLRHDLINIMQTPDIRESRGEGMSVEETRHLVHRYREIVKGLGIWDVLKAPPISAEEAEGLRARVEEMTKLADAAMFRHLEMLERAEAAEDALERANVSNIAQLDMLQARLTAAVDRERFLEETLAQIRAVFVPLAPKTKNGGRI